MTMFDRIKNHLSAFKDDTRGYINTESMILMPVLLWIFMAMWVYFDVFRQQSVNQKASFTIADMMSRETHYINHEYIDNTYRLLQHLTKTEMAEATTVHPDLDLRVTIVKWNNQHQRYDMRWSQSRGNAPALAARDVRTWADRLPNMVHNEQLIVVETWEMYHPIGNVGLGATDLKTFTFTKPRFAPQVVFDANGTNGNNGWGNGDQDAPGGSLCNNNAENATDCG